MNDIIFGLYKYKIKKKRVKNQKRPRCKKKARVSKVYQIGKSTIPPQAGMGKMRDTYSLTSLPSFNLMFQDSASNKNKVSRK